MYRKVFIQNSKTTQNYETVHVRTCSDLPLVPLLWDKFGLGIGLGLAAMSRLLLRLGGGFGGAAIFSPFGGRGGLTLSCSIGWNYVKWSYTFWIAWKLTFRKWLTLFGCLWYIWSQFAQKACDKHWPQRRVAFRPPHNSHFIPVGFLVPEKII